MIKVFVLCLFLSVSLASDQAKSQNITKLKPFIEHIVSLYLNGSINQIYDPPYPPDGGYIIKFEYDVTGDGEEEIFIHSGLKDLGRYGALWNVYGKDRNGGYELIIEDINMGQQLLIINGKDGGKTLVLSEGSTKHGQGFDVYHYTFSAEGKVKKEKVMHIDVEDYWKWHEGWLASSDRDGEVKKLYGLDDFVRVRGERIMLKDFLENPEGAKWIPIEWRKDHLDGWYLMVEGKDGEYYKLHENPYLEGDRERAKGFTPQQAKELLEKWTGEKLDETASVKQHNDLNGVMNENIELNKVAKIEENTISEDKLQNEKTDVNEETECQPCILKDYWGYWVVGLGIVLAFITSMLFYKNHKA